MEPQPIPLSARVFKDAITNVEERLLKLHAIVDSKRKEADLEQDPMRHAELAREWAEGHWAATRARIALDLLKGDTLLALQPKLTAFPCAFCLGHYDEYALENPAMMGFLPMARQKALKDRSS